MKMKYMVDLKSLMEFKARRDMKQGLIQHNYNDIKVTCANHPYDKAIPKIFTKNGWGCVACHS